MANVTVHKTSPAPTKKETEIGETTPRASLVWNPFRMFRGFFDFDPFRAIAPFEDMPTLTAAFDVKETPDAYTFIADVPGIKNADLDVSLSGRQLTIRGKRESKKEEKGEQLYSCERSFGSFLRSFTLPDDANVEQIKAETTDGVLTITVGKTPGTPTKKIEIAEKKPS